MKTIFLFFLLFTSSIVFSQQMPDYFTGKNGIAIGGYDLVNYFSKGTAEIGSSKNVVVHDNATFHFKNKKNKAKFIESPEKYLPKYNGYCAFGLGKIQKQFPVDPKSFKIIDGELYLFFVGEIQGKLTDSQDLWNMDQTNLKINADKAWSQKQQQLLNQKKLKMMDTKQIAKKYFEAFHEGKLEEVYTYLADNCTVQYATEEPAEAELFFKQSAPMIATLKFKTNGIYTSSTTDKVIIDFSYTTPKSDNEGSKTIRAIDIIEFNDKNQISKVKVIPNQ